MRTLRDTCCEIPGGLETRQSAPIFELHGAGAPQLREQRRAIMVNVSRFGPRADYLGDLVDDLFKGFLVRPMYSEDTHFKLFFFFFN